MKITPADKYFSLCIRERTNWTCEFCRKTYERGSRGLHCSHFIGRGNYAVRFDAENAYCHCFYCHNYLGSNPHIFTNWVKEQLGNRRYSALIKRSNSIDTAKNNRRNISEIASYYQKIHDTMIDVRNNGYQGRIDLV